jgi:uncharacterized membrane protein
MPKTIESYISRTVVDKLRRRAFFVWGISTFIIAFWILLIVTAPIAQTNDLTSVANPIYKFYSFICHQISARSFFIGAEPFAVCSRCFGIYFGLFVGFLLFPFLRPVEETAPFPYFWLFLAMIPMLIDWSLGFFEIWENNHLSRFVTGLILGAVCAIFLVPALVEILRLLAKQGKVKRLSS